MDEIASENFEKLRALTLRLDRAVHESIPGVPEGFKPFEAFESDFKKVADSVSFSLAELLGFVRAESPRELLYWDDSQAHGPTGTSGFGPPTVEVAQGKRAVASELLAERDWWSELGVETTRVPGPDRRSGSDRSRGWRTRLRDVLNPNRTEGVRILGRAMLPALLNGSSRPLLVVGKSDNAVSFAKHAMSANRVQVDWWTHERRAPARMPSLGRIRLEGASYDVYGEHDSLGGGAYPLDADTLWDHGDEDAPVVRSAHRRLRHLWTRIPELFSTYKNAIAYFEARRPAAVICGTADSDRFQVIRQAATASGIPLVSFQHGGAYGYMHSEWLKLSDLRADLYVAYGAGGSGYLKDFAKSRDLTTSIVGIGWSRGATLSGGLKESATTTRQGSSNMRGGAGGGQRVIMYVPTGLGGEVRYGPDHGYHDTEYCLEQVRVIESLRKIPDVVVVVKLHPKDHTDNPMERWVRQLGDDRVQVLVGGRLPEALAQSDLVVLDCPTTTLLELMAMASRLVYLHLGILKWTPEGESLMRETAPWVDVTPGWETRLGEAVVQALEEPAPIPNDNRFLDTYANLDFQPVLVWDKLRDIRDAQAAGSN
jgi:hypothetical protein